jgi:hypothetical protein
MSYEDASAERLKGEAGKRVHVLSHRGVEILQLDFADVRRTDEALDAIAEARGAITTRAPNSVRTLTVVHNSLFNVEIARALWRLARADKRYVRAAAVVGVTGMQEVVLNLVSRMSRREFATFGDMEAAKDWLAEQT